MQRTLVKQVYLLQRHPGAGVIPAPPLFADYASLGIQGILFATDVAGPVPEQGQNGIDKRISRHRGGIDVVNGFIA